MMDLNVQIVVVWGLFTAGEVDPEHTYMVLHFDTDPYARLAALAYANAVELVNSRFADDIRQKLEEVARRSKPRVVCLCGSTKFMDEYKEANCRLTLDGVIVLTVGVNFKVDHEFLHLSDKEIEEAKIKMDELYKQKIDLADEIFVINVGGYIGSSTKAEIEYAHHSGKLVTYLEPSAV